MERILVLLVALVAVVSVRAQTPDFTISRTNGSSGLAICPAETVTFMASIQADSYSWEINGSVVPSEVNVGQPQVWIDESWGYGTGSTIRCVAQTSTGTKYSNTLITTTCVPPVLPNFGINITVLPDRYPPVYCADEVSFKSEASHSATFQWFKNGVSVYSTSTPAMTSTYIPANLAGSDVISVTAYAANPQEVDNDSDSETLPTNVFSIGQPVDSPEIFISDNSTGRCQGADTYLYAVAAHALNFEWSLSPSIAGTLTTSVSNNSSCQITWSNTFSGIVTITVNAIGCVGDEKHTESTYQVYGMDSPPSFQSMNYCIIESPRLVAAPPALGSIVKWYDQSNTFLGEGLDQYVPIASEGTYTFQAETVTSKGCVSERATATLTISSTPCDDKLNWYETISYDETGTPVNHSKDYFDQGGQNLQSQWKTFERPAIFNTQIVLDNLGRPALTTLPAPTMKSGFEYDHYFVRSSATARYDAGDFDDLATKYDPTAVDNTVAGTLGWYYSENNSLEPLTPKTEFPYSRVEFYDDGTGEVKRAATEGDVHRLGSGHETVTGSFAVYNELDDYVLKRPVAIQGLTQDGSLSNEGTQSVARDQNGNFAISISDKSGQSVMSARKGTAEDHVLMVTNNVSASATSDGNGCVYFYILHDQPISITGGGTFTVHDMLSEQPYNVSGTENWTAGFYRIKVLSGNVNFTYANFYKDVAYQFFDDVGRLRAAISPNGYKTWVSSNISNVYQTLDKTTYAYNHQGWLLSMNEPDAGETRYVYRKDGKIRFSQNAEQLNQNRFSYTHYDQLGRPVESGEYKGTSLSFLPMSDPSFSQSGMKAELEKVYDQVTWAATEKKDWVRTHYDYAVSGSDLPSGFTQEFVRGTVSSTENVNIRTWYSYDEQGRVVWMAQKPKALNRTFVTEYSYDFLGNVLTVKNAGYQANAAFDLFYHHYEYDADNRLAKALTSTDGSTKKLRATYEYYLHGPLKRIELGEQLQGIDFVYNINGWLTQINHPDHASDPGNDGNQGSSVRPDVFGMMLDYYESSVSNLYSANMSQPLNDPGLIHGFPSIQSRQLTASHQPLIRFRSIYDFEADPGATMRFKEYSAEKSRYKEMLSGNSQNSGYDK